MLCLPVCCVASFVVGMKYLKRKKYDEAVRHLNEAANGGHSGAQCCLGTLFEEGRGVALCDVTAVRWYRKAADQQHPQVHST